MVVDLAVTPPKLTVFFADSGDSTDIPGVAVGDFNGDGIGDLLLGARFGDGPDNTRQDAGEAYLIFGRSDLGGSVDIAQGQQDMTILGGKTGDNLGYSVAAGDLNADGIDDIIVAAPMSEGPDATARTDRGEVYVIFGRRDLGGIVDIAEGPQDLTIVAAEGFSLLGDSMDVCDVNGDDIEDVILGAPFAGRVPGSPPGGPRTELGEVYVVFGSASLGGSIAIAEGQQDFTIKGPERFSELGDAVACGDVNGDGIADIIAVAEAADGPNGDRPNAGQAYVVFGSRDLAGLIVTAEGQQDAIILGGDPQDALGLSAASGDVNGDGTEDILLVAQRADGPGNTRDAAGEAYVVFGSRAIGGTIDTAAGEQSLTIVAADDHDLLSSSAARGDINGDDIDDILLGAPFGEGPDNAGDSVGELHIIYGSKALGGAIDLAQAAQAIVIYGADTGDRLASSVASGDLDGDGELELVLVAPYAAGPDNSRPGAGEAYVISLAQR
jgi:hypothetical protein